MAKHETFSALMNAGMAWGAIVGVLVFFADESVRLLVGGLASIGFWSVISTYFCWDYHKTHKKPEQPTDFPPLSSQTIEPTKPTKVKHRKLTFIKNTFFIALGIAESAYLLSLILLWEIVTIPVGGVNVPVLTYQNGLLIGFFIIGAFLAVDIARRLRHPKEAFFDE